MQLRNALAAALVILSIPAGAHEITLRHEYSADDGSVVHIPGMELNLEPWEGGSISAGARVDSLTAASDQPITDVDSVTAASDKETRTEFSLGLTQEVGRWRLGLGGFFGDEPDYRSTGFNWRISRDLFQRCTTLSLSGNHGWDELDRLLAGSEDPSFHEEAHRSGGTLALTQVLTPGLVGRLALSYSRVRGYQANPYRYATRSHQVPEFENREVLPEERDRYALTGRVSWYLEPLRSALKPSYRFYWDDWGIRGHELDLKLLRYWRERLLLRLQARLYRQSAADFHRDLWWGPEEYMTSYAKYDQGTNWYGGGGFRYWLEGAGDAAWNRFLEGLSLGTHLGYYHRGADDRGGLVGVFTVSRRW